MNDGRIFGRRRVGMGSWYARDAYPVGIVLGADSWLAEYGDGIVIVPTPTLETDEPMPDQVDTTIDPWDRHEITGMDTLVVHDERRVGRFTSEFSPTNRAEAAFRALRGDELPTDEQVSLEDPASLGARPATPRARRRNARTDRHRR